MTVVTDINDAPNVDMLRKARNDEERTMTRKEAVEILRDKAYLFHGEEVKALGMAIKALEQEPCEDKRTDKRTRAIVSADKTQLQKC